MKNKRNSYRKWQQDEIDLLIDLIQTKPSTQICKIMNRSYQSVRGMVAVMGLKSSYNPADETRKESVRKKISSTLQGIPLEDWDGFKETANALIRKSIPYKQWRQTVFKRDWFSCVICRRPKGKGVVIEADHIKSFASYPDLRLEVSNGRTLCRDCHMRTDTWGGRSKLKEQNESRSIKTSLSS